MWGFVTFVFEMVADLCGISCLSLRIDFGMTYFNIIPISNFIEVFNDKSFKIFFLGNPNITIL